MGLFGTRSPRNDPAQVRTADLCDPLPETDVQERKQVCVWGGTPALPNEAQLRQSVQTSSQLFPLGPPGVRELAGGRPRTGGAVGPRSCPLRGGAAGPYLVPAVPRARQGAVAGAQRPVREVPGQLVQGGRGAVLATRER